MDQICRGTNLLVPVEKGEEVMDRGWSFCCVIITKNPHKWREFISFCDQWGIFCVVLPNYEDVGNLELRESPFFFTDEQETAEKLLTDEHGIVFPSVSVPALVKLLETFAYDLVPVPMEMER